MLPYPAMPPAVPPTLPADHPDAASPFTPLPPSFYRRPSAEVARDLLGRYVVRTVPAVELPSESQGESPGRPQSGGPGGSREHLVLRLVETEAYQGEGDRASHAHAGPVTPRSRRLFRPGGHAYVYLIYGMHHCLNAVTGGEDDGTAVLLRAGEPVEGADAMAVYRGLADKPRRPRPGDLAGGPGKLCQALGVDLTLDGAPLWGGELTITAGEPVLDAEVVTGRRVGVDYAGEAAHWPLRFAVRGNRHVSRPRLG